VEPRESAQGSRQRLGRARWLRLCVSVRILLWAGIPFSSQGAFGGCARERVAHWPAGWSALMGTCSIGAAGQLLWSFGPTLALWHRVGGGGPSGAAAPAEQGERAQAVALHLASSCSALLLCRRVSRTQSAAHSPPHTVCGTLIARPNARHAHLKAGHLPQAAANCAARELRGGRIFVTCTCTCTCTIEPATQLWALSFCLSHTLPLALRSLSVPTWSCAAPAESLSLSLFLAIGRRPRCRNSQLNSPLLALGPTSEFLHIRPNSALQKHHTLTLTTRIGHGSAPTSRTSICLSISLSHSLSGSNQTHL